MAKASSSRSAIEERTITWRSLCSKRTLRASITSIATSRKVVQYHRFQRSAGGSRTHLKLLCRQPPCRLAPALSSASSPGIEPGPRPSQGRVQDPPHPEDSFLPAPRRGIEPRPAVPKTVVLSGTPARLVDGVSRPGIGPGPGPSEGPVRSTTPSRQSSIPTWSRTRTRALGEPRAIRYTIGTAIRSRRLDLHQHRAVYKTAASLLGHVGNQQECEESNPVGRLWRPLPLPGGHPCSTAPGLAAGSLA